MTLSAKPLSKEKLDEVRLDVAQRWAVTAAVTERLIATIDAQAKVIEAARTWLWVGDYKSQLWANTRNAFDCALTDLDKPMEGKDG